MEKKFVEGNKGFGGPIFIQTVEGHDHNDDIDTLHVIAAFKFTDGTIIENIPLELTIHPIVLAGMVANLIYCDDGIKFRKEYEESLAEFKIEAKRSTN